MENKTKQKFYLSTEALLKFFTNKDEKIETMILCRPDDVELMTTDQSLYEAIGSIQDRSKIDYNKLVKLLEVTTILPYEQVAKKERFVLTPERVDELNKNIGGE